jgi:hypothetical protein
VEVPIQACCSWAHAVSDVWITEDKTLLTFLLRYVRRKAFA